MNRRVTIAVLVSAATLLGAGLAWRSVHQRTAVQRHLPPAPELAGWPAELGAEISLAEAKARGWTGSVDGLIALSRLYHANGFYHPALACYQGLRELQPREPRWPHLEASILASFGRMDEALPLALAASELAPGYPAARLRAADILVKSNRPAEAVRHYEAVLQAFPENPYALLGLARTRVAAQDWAAARQYLERSIREHPDFIGGLSLLVTVSDRLGDQATAETLRLRIGRREFTDMADPWIDGLADLCYDAYRLSVAAAVANFSGDPERARTLLERAISLSTQNSSYRRQLAQMMLNNREYQNARTHLEQAVAQSPTDSDSWILLVDALDGLGRADLARQAIFSGLGNCPESPTLRVRYARELKDSGRLAEAAIEFGRGYELRPSEVAPLVELAEVLFALDRVPEAVAALQRALSRQPNHPMALATMMFYEIGNNNEAAARARWQQIRAQPRTPPEVVAGLRQAFQDQFGSALR